MRKIDWNAVLSDEDVAWVRQAGFLSEERIAHHQAQFDAEVPPVEAEEDTVVRSALDPDARVFDRVNVESGPIDNSLPIVTDPVPEDDEDEEELDYDKWKISELEDEIAARNEMADTTSVSVTGTGKDGKIVKADLVKGLRLWDDENPDALKN